MFHKLFSPVQIGGLEIKNRVTMTAMGVSLAAAGGADVILSTSNSTKSMVDSIQGLRPDGRLVVVVVSALKMYSWPPAAFAWMALS